MRAGWVQAIRFLPVLPWPAPWLAAYCICITQCTIFGKLAFFIRVNRQATKPYWNQMDVGTWVPLRWMSVPRSEEAVSKPTSVWPRAAYGELLPNQHLHLTAAALKKHHCSQMFFLHILISFQLLQYFLQPLLMCLPWHWNPHGLPVTFLIDF